MNRNAANWTLLLGLLVLGLLAFTFSQSGGGIVTAAAPDAVPAAQATPTQHIASLGGAPVGCTNQADGTCALNTTGGGGGGASTPFPYGVGTAIPVQGRVGIGTPVTGINPVVQGFRGFDDNVYVPFMGAIDDSGNAGDAVQQAGVRLQAYDAVNNLYERVRIEPTRKALLVQGATPIPQFTQVAFPTALPAGEAHLGSIGGNTVRVAVTMVRPADTTAYAALDVMAAPTPLAIPLAGMCRVAGGSGIITKVRQMTDQSTNVAQIRHQVYHQAPTPVADNAPFALLFANDTRREGYIDMAANATEGTGSNAANSLNADVRLPYRCDNGDTSLYLIPETLTVFTPASGQTWFFEYMASQD